MTSLVTGINGLTGFNRRDYSNVQVNATIDINIANSLIYIVCDGDWGLYACRWGELQAIAEYTSHQRFSTNYHDNTILTITNLYIAQNYVVFSLGM